MKETDDDEGMDDTGWSVESFQKLRPISKEHLKSEEVES